MYKAVDKAYDIYINWRRSMHVFGWLVFYGSRSIKANEHDGIENKAIDGGCHQKDSPEDSENADKEKIDCSGAILKLEEVSGKECENIINCMKKGGYSDLQENLDQNSEDKAIQDKS